MQLPLERDASLRPHNTFAVEARAAWLARIDSVDALRAVLADERVRDLPRLVIGGGSNLLLTRDFPGLVLLIGIPGLERAGETEDAWIVRVGAGEPWHATVERLLALDLPGLENLALIPGTVGAAPIQNIGAYGLELAERLHAVEVLDLESGALRSLTPQECDFGYRDSAFKRALAGRVVITAVSFALPKRWQPVAGYAELAAELRARGAETPAPRDVFDAVVAIRSRKLPDPARIGNAGSFFKNPIVSHEQRQVIAAHHPALVAYPLAGQRYKLAAGWLIEAAGLKGATRGQAGVYERQALVLVNRGGATGAEILQLAREVQDTVQARFGVKLEPEPVIV
ncbi:MAG TPA: UDP-N-acetylmuramate dehydrogenase [Burkholderiaceae bacterium]|nr:UDP-N-acetylmuramate dehydrogenase [Burkholderiaceae bacterium]HRZ01945.1 UDP-N-acetylmuramate dehydrogenase [Burkholderiaceae bacterium]